ncbi:uncharacterized protein K441DRAFT_356664 [Cenococcum geophilum 1.58]|uniref:Uncharacterized protein n=1 Tax=Cenococcum geophilum 1.58 TaxID=794803 RepID=A0ACC8EM81_9PEZI|nr:hypothetical protein K441DRAFT_356664 [Cenococcum geophilum 1.58]
MRIRLLPHARRAGIAPDSPVLMPRVQIYPRRHDGRRRSHRSASTPHRQLNEQRSGRRGAVCRTHRRRRRRWLWSRRCGPAASRRRGRAARPSRCRCFRAASRASCRCCSRPSASLCRCRTVESVCSRGVASDGG